jgi:hypothetical protein
MLISMPTGTSTIFGVFQAILALLLKSDDIALRNKIMRIEKFASEIFFHKRGPYYAAAQKEFTYLCDLVSKQRGINGFIITLIPPNPGLGWARAR